jgi:hypothetical protein
MVHLGMASALATHLGSELGVCQDLHKSLLPLAVGAGDKVGVRGVRPNLSH